MCLLQCGGLWFVNGKVSITWNLKQAVVQKPKTSALAEGTCFLKPKAADVEKLKSLPPPDNDDIDPDGAVASTIVEDSDEEFELPPPTPAVVEKPVEVVAPAPAPVEEKKKRVITKKTA
jgi:hypothetical protein